MLPKVAEFQLGAKGYNRCGSQSERRAYNSGQIWGGPKGRGHVPLRPLKQAVKVTVEEVETF